MTNLLLISRAQEPPEVKCGRKIVPCWLFRLVALTMGYLVVKKDAVLCRFIRSIRYDFFSFFAFSTELDSQDSSCLNLQSRISGAPIVWKFVREEWTYLVDRFSLNDRSLGRLPLTITSDFSSNFQLQETKDFFAKYPEAGAGDYRFQLLIIGRFKCHQQDGRGPWL